ncbi:hypothetical protein ISS04_04135 [Candidatus Woesearchaeota archaeon]|nr:hypothetical protein [Candidatus Woesearchaeota archaeon]
MGIMDKVMFWKKEEGLSDPLSDSSLSDLGTAPKDDLGLGDPLKDPLSQDPLQQQAQTHDLPEFNSQDLSKPLESTLSPPMQDPGNLPGKHAGAQPAPEIPKGSIELISSKLDTIKSSMENINLRLAKIENYIESSHKKDKGW